MKRVRSSLIAAVAMSAFVAGPNHSHRAEAQVAGAATGETTKASLNRRLPEVRLQGVGLADAFDFVRDVSGCNLVINWKALEAAGVSRDTQVNLRLNGVTLRKLLSQLLTEAGSGTALTFVVEDGVIEITTQEIADSRLYMKVYPIDDLLIEIPDFTDAPNFNLANRQSSGGGKGGSGGGGGSLFNEGGSGDRGKESVKSREDKAKEIVDLIMATIRPDVWRENGGVASIRFFNGSLIVTAPLSVHELIGG